MHMISCSLTRAWLTFSFVAVSTVSAVAQAPAATANAGDEVITLDKFVVTGSHLSVAPNAVPVTVIDAEAIRRGGVATNVLEVLRKQMPAFSGSGNVGLNSAGVTNVQTYGGARISLHGLPTLVLLNGRRVATNGANGRGNSSFVDVSMFPLEAIERIEVLGDGASAIYGSDAIGGVVNIILKPSFNGSAIGGRYAFSTGDGAYSEHSAHVATGVTEGRVSVIASVDYSKSRPLLQDTRAFSNDARTGIFSGVVGSGSSAMLLNPSLNSPRQTNPTGTAATAANMNALVANGTYTAGASTLNLAPDVTLLAGREQVSAYAGVTVKLIDRKLEAFGDILYSDADVLAQLGAQFATFTVLDNSPYNPVNGNVPGVAFRYLPAPRQYRTSAEGIRGTAGFRGEISPAWNWEAAYTTSRNKLVSKITNVLYSPNLSAAVAGGYDQNGNLVTGGAYSLVRAGYSESIPEFVVQPALDPFARAAGINPASLANVLGTSRADFRSTLDSIDAVVRGRPFDLPAGSLGVAVGGDYRTEELSGEPDENSRNTGSTARRWSGGSFFDPFSEERQIHSFFAELHVPVTSPQWNFAAFHSLDLTVAYRMEDYSDAGESRVPKFGVRWQPIDEQVTLRYTYSKGFAAPTLFALFGAPSQGFVSANTALGYPSSPVFQVTAQTGANPNLKPATSKSTSVGVVLAPKILPGLRFSLDYLDVEQTGSVGTVGTTTILQSVNQLGSASPYASQITLGGAAITTPAAGQVRAYIDANNPNTVVVSDTRRNLSAGIVRVVDAKIDYTRKIKSFGELDLGTIGTFFIDDKIQSLPSERYYEYAGHATSAEGTIPGYRFYSTAAWRMAGFEAQIAHSYIAPVDDIGAGGRTFENSTSLRRIRIPSFTAWDVSLAYTMESSAKKLAGFGRELVLRVGVNNVFDKLAPAAPQAFPTTSAAGADTGTYGVIGSLYFVSADFKF